MHTLPAGYTDQRLVRASRTSVVYGALRRSDEARVIIKVYPVSGETAAVRVRHEYEVLRSIDLPCVVKPIELATIGNTMCLVMERFDGVPLHDYVIEPNRRIQRFLEIAIQIADALSRVHAKRVLHLDLKPSNILINPQSGQLCLSDFGIAESLGHKIGEHGLPAQHQGTLLYMSPEQTGRTGQGVDYRSDLYSLGVTLYELSTGQRPFDGEDPLELVHAHLARTPRAPIEVAPTIPPTVSRIILRLLAKMPEQRYQSATGLMADLRRCAAEHAENGTITEFALGDRDASPELAVPHRLYGRSEESRALHHAFEALRTSTSPSLVTISGPPGIGKTSLANQIQPAVLNARGLFGSGKFRHGRRDVACGALCVAIREVLRQVLSLKPQELGSWRRHLAEALQPSAQVLIEQLPELELLLGPQNSVSELPAKEAQRRFFLLFHRLVAILATPDHPVILHLDDLQWADPASTALVRDLLMADEGGHLMVIFSYRPGELGDNRLAAHMLETLRRDVKSTHLELAPLSSQNIARLIADTLGSTTARTSGLAEAVAEKTDGNPFFIRAFLGSLASEGLLYFDPDNGWDWQLQHVREHTASSNVIDLLVEHVCAAPPATLEVLRLAACLDARFDLERLCLVGGLEPQTAFEAVQPALEMGLLLAKGATWSFPHDRVQEAAYSMMTGPQQRQLHLDIGRRLLVARNRGESISALDVADHLTRARSALVDHEELREFATLCRDAGVEASKGTDHRAAVRYFQASIDALPEDAWDRDHDLSLSLYQSLGEMLSLIGDHEGSAEVLEEAIANGRTATERTPATRLMIRQLAVRARVSEAIDVGRKALVELGIDLPTTDHAAHLQCRMAQLEELLSTTTLETLVEAEASTGEHRCAQRILDAITPAMYLADQAAYPLAVIEAVRTSILHGPAPASATAFTTFGVILAGVFGQHIRACEFTKLGAALAERFGDLTEQGKVAFLSRFTVESWANPYQAALPRFEHAFEAGLQVGDAMFPGYAVSAMAYFKLFTGLPLAEVQQANDRALNFITSIRNSWTIAGPIMLQHLLYALDGNEDSWSSYPEHGRDETAFVESCRKTGSMGNWLFYHFTMRAFSLYLEGDAAAAVEAAKQAHTHEQSVLAQVITVQPRFFEGLAHLELARTQPNGSEHLETARASLDWLRARAHLCPENLEHLCLTLEAEIAAVEGRKWQAIELYDRALDRAQQTKSIYHSAIAGECAARFWFSVGRQRIARSYLTAAYDDYRRWGATRKVERLDKEYPFLALSIQVPEAMDPIGTSTTRTLATTDHSAIDLASVFKASKAITEAAGEAVVCELMRTAVENAGARRGALFLIVHDRASMSVHYTVDEDVQQFTPPLPLEEAQEYIPTSIIRYTISTGTSVLLADASETGDFINDHYVVEHTSRSIISIPIRRKGTLTGILYLDNDLLANAFSDERLELLQLLAGQAAIAIENARLVDGALETTKGTDPSHADEVNETQQSIGDLVRRAAMAEVSSGVIHNIGNLTNAVLTSSHSLTESPIGKQTQMLSRLVGLLRDNENNLGDFLTSDPRGKKIPQFLSTLADKFAEDSKAISEEAQRMQKHAKMIQTAVHSHQAYAGVARRVEQLAAEDLMEEAVAVCAAARPWRTTTVTREFSDNPIVTTDRNQTLQILVNLIKNARESNESQPDSEHQIRLGIRIQNDSVRFSVTDTGVGLSPEAQSKLFEYGFTTKATGHGFGLHSAVKSAASMGGRLTAHSDGVGQGACFTLELPLEDTLPQAA